MKAQKPNVRHDDREDITPLGAGTAPSAYVRTEENARLLHIVSLRATSLLEHDQVLSDTQFVLPRDIELYEGCRSPIDYVRTACEVFGERRAFGFRRVTSGPGRKIDDDYTWVTYAQFWDRLTDVAGGLRSYDAVDVSAKIGFLGTTGIEYVVSEYACHYLGATVCPLPTTVPISDIVQLLDQGCIETLFVGTVYIDLAAELVNRCPRLRRLVLIGDASLREVEDGDIERLMQTLRREDLRSLSIKSLAQVESDGRSCGKPSRPNSEDKNCLRLVLYTSGSTGLPKGVMMTDRILAAYWRKAVTEPRGSLPGVDATLPQVEIGVSYMPQNHLMGQLNVIESIARGGTLHFTTLPDMSTLLDDIRLARPTTLTLVPRVAQAIQQAWRAELGKRDVPDQEMLGRTLLGNRLMFMRTGTAPTGDEVAGFLQRAFQVPVYDMYGSTEAGYVSFENRITDSVVYAHCLVNVPELGYLTSDTPYPRGELRIKTVCGTVGYLENAQASRDLFDANGFIKTGDIFEHRPNGEYIWIDRCSNVVKLAHGEFVSLWRLESLYVDESELISQIYLHADSKQDHIVGVVVPTRGIQANIEHDRMADDDLKKALVAEFHRIAGENHLQSFEVPRNFLIEHTPFSQENGLLTDSSKPARLRLKERYDDALRSLYEQSGNIREHYRELLGQSESLSIRDRVTYAIAAVVGARVDPDNGPLAFRELGGDSLAALELADLLGETTGCQVPVSLILDPSVDIFSVLIDFIEHLPAASPGCEMPDQVLPNSPPTLEDLRRADVLGPCDERFSPASQTTKDDPKFILLTGSNGFLGRSLAVDLLGAIPEGGRVYCLVRGRSREDATQRFLSGYGPSDSRRNSIMPMLETDRLVILAGDLTRRRFGWDIDVWRNLAQRIDTVIHGGALVNHAFSYNQLFVPNVGGTAEVARFVTAFKAKRIHFISTVATGACLKRGMPFYEHETAPSLCAAYPLDGFRPSGYAASKWAAEVLLESVAKTCCLPLTIYRCGLLLPHTTIAGEANQIDTLSRFIKSVARVGIAPTTLVSRYGPLEVGGLPVNIASGAITRIILNSALTPAIYHVSSEAGRGLEVNHLLHHLIERRPKIRQITRYETWMVAFEEALAALEEKERAMSVYAILDQWRSELADLDAVDISNFLAVANLATGTAIPELSRNYYEKYLDDLGIPGDPIVSSASPHRAIPSRGSP